LFKEFGLLQVRLPRDDNGAHRGIAFIDVETQLHAENALILKKQSLHGRQLEIYLSKPPAETSQEIKELTVYVSQMQGDCTEHELRELFES